jgi:hypothetical protein
MAYNGKDVNLFNNGVVVSSTNRLPVDSSTGLLAGVSFDAIDVQQTSATVETYVYKSGGISGTTVKTIVVTYTDSTKENIDTVVAT